MRGAPISSAFNKADRQRTHTFWVGDGDAVRAMRADELLDAFEAGELPGDTPVRIVRDAPPRPLHRYATELVWTVHQLRSEAQVVDDHSDGSMFAAAFEGAPIGMVLSDLLGRIRHANAAFCALVGYAHDDLCALSVGQISDARDRAQEIALGNRLLAGELDRFQVEKRFRTKAGAVIDTVTSIALVRHTDGSPGWIVAHVMDITAVKQLESSVAESNRALALSEQRFSNMFRHGPQATLIVDAAHRIVQANEGALALFRCTETALVGRGVHELVPAEDQVRPDALMVSFEAAQHGTRMASGPTVQVIRGDGSGFEAEINLVGLGAGGERQMLVGLTDITERLTAERAIRRSLDEKATLLKEIHHRVKNNLQTISSLLMLQSERGITAETRALLLDSVHRVRSMALLHEQIYGVESLGRIGLRAYLTKLSAYVRDSMAPDARVHVVGDEIEVELVQAVPLAMALNELITNAVKYGISRGSAPRRAPRRLPEDCDVRVELTIDGDRLRISVTDAGEGPPPVLDARGSATLGAELIRSLSRQLRARVSVDGGGGARVTLDVPLHLET